MLKVIAFGVGVIVAGAGLVEPARAQVNPQVYGGFGAEDGYNDDGFGWGPAYRPDTTFRPAYGFYGGVERPYPYGGGVVQGRPAPAYGYEEEPEYVRPRRVVRTRKVSHRHAYQRRRIIHRRVVETEPGVWR